MKSNLLRSVFAFVIGLTVSVAWANPVENIESYGIYVVADKGYVKVGPYSQVDNFVDFKYLNEIPFVKRADQALKLIVYSKNFHPDSITFELRPIDTIVDVREIKLDAKPLAKPDMYAFAFSKPVNDGVMLHVRYGNFFNNNFGVIMLGDTQTQLVNFFSQKNLPNASIVVQYLEDARIAFPKNTELKTLTKYWEKAAKQEKDKKGYAYVEEKWDDYQNAEKLTLKQRYLNELIGEINGYLNDHPDGYKAAEAKKRKRHAEDKLKEYEKLL